MLILCALLIYYSLPAGACCGATPTTEVVIGSDALQNQQAAYHDTNRMNPYVANKKRIQPKRKPKSSFNLLTNFNSLAKVYFDNGALGSKKDNQTTDIFNPDFRPYIPPATTAAFVKYDNNGGQSNRKDLQYVRSPSITNFAGEQSHTEIKKKKYQYANLYSKPTPIKRRLLSPPIQNRRTNYWRGIVPYHKKPYYGRTLRTIPHYSPTIPILTTTTPAAAAEEPEVE